MANRHTYREQKNWHLRNEYGITFDEWSRMLIEQRGRCGICGGPMTGTIDPVVDHCHATGRVRGLLCRGCNVSLGFYEKADIDAIEKYLGA